MARAASYRRRPNPPERPLNPPLGRLPLQLDPPELRVVFERCVL